jgi:DNA-binding transcriptional ArsR family regulator
MGSRDYTEEVLTSNHAYRILRHLFQEGEDYPTGIAKGLDSSYQSVNNYMKGLRARKLVEKTREEGKKQFYSLNEEGVTALWSDLWHQKFDSMSNEQWETITHRLNQEFEIKDSTSDDISFQEEWTYMEDLFDNYWRNYFETVEESNLEKTMIKDFITPLALYVEGAIGQGTDLESWVVLWERIMVSAYLEKDTDGVESFLKALEETKNKG